MSERSFDAETERRSESSRAAQERESSSSVRLSSIETIHRQVGNQAVQDSYTPSGLRDPVGLGGASDKEDQDSGDKETSGDHEESNDRKQSGSGRGKHGPQRTGKFIVEFDEGKVPGWKSVTIPSMSIEQGSYRDGTEAPQPKKVAGQPTDDDVGTKHVEIGLWGWLQNLLDGNSDVAGRDISATVEDEESDTADGDNN